MNSNVLNIVTFIFLSLDNVAACSSSRPETPSQQKQPSIEKLEGGHDLKGTRSFSCSSVNLYHKWYQGYQNGIPQIAIGNIPTQKGVKTTRFFIKVEEFDNNTEIYCVNSSDDTSKEETENNLLIRRFINAVIDKISVIKSFNIGSNELVSRQFYKTLIKVKANETCKENEELSILDYNEKQNVSFSCHVNTTHINKTKEYSNHIKENKTTYVQLGLINTTSNMIETYESNAIHKIFNRTQNGLILCCVYYVVTESAEEKWITRYVEKKTLLLYNDTDQQDALGAKEILSNSANSTGTDSTADPGNQTIIVIITTAVAVVFILLVITVICKKRCRKKTESDNKVLYADLDILRQIEPDNFSRPGPEEESPYAQIIGVIRPQIK